jgi:acyl carrier protein
MLNLDMQSLETELLAVVNQVRRNKGLPGIQILTDDSHLCDDLQFDSLDLAELTVRIEERFGVDVFEEGIVHRWGDICARVARHAARH